MHVFPLSLDVTTVSSSTRIELFTSNLSDCLHFLHLIMPKLAKSNTHNTSLRSTCGLMIQFLIFSLPTLAGLLLCTCHMLTLKNWF